MMRPAERRVVEQYMDHLESLKTLIKKQIKDQKKFNKEYFKNIDDALTITIKGHLYIEKQLNDLLDILLVDPSYFKAGKFSTKVEILNAMNFSPALNLTDALKSINRIRNNYSHQLDIGIRIEDVEIQKLRKIFQSYRKEQNTVESELKHLINLTILYLLILKVCWSGFPIALNLAANYDRYSSDKNLLEVGKAINLKNVATVIRELGEFTAKL
jgi:hypothetical protein